MSAQDLSNSAGHSRAAEEMDPQVEAFLRECEDASDEVTSEDLNVLLRSVEAQLAQSERGAGGWLKSRPTLTRRALSLSSFVALSVLAFFAMHGRGIAELPPWVVVTCLASLGFLSAISLWVALRPLQKPPLSTLKVATLATVSVACAVVVAFIPEAAHVRAVGASGGPASPCLYAGLLFGLPVYALSRLLDRGSRLSSILAASAAGLTGNFILALNCPVHDPVHAIVGHASVVVLFVLGAIMVRAVETHIRASS